MDGRKPITWIGSSKKDLLDFPRVVQRMMGYSLNLIQQGLDDPDTTIMTGFGSGNVREITKDDEGGTYRTVYTVEFEEAIYVLHAFKKKSKKGKATPKPEMDKIASRLKDAKYIHKQLGGRK